jgi:hypothetical protein
MPIPDRRRIARVGPSQPASTAPNPSTMQHFTMASPGDLLISYTLRSPAWYLQLPPTARAHLHPPAPKPRREQAPYLTSMCCTALSHFFSSALRSHTQKESALFRAHPRNVDPREEDTRSAAKNSLVKLQQLPQHRHQLRPQLPVLLLQELQQDRLEVRRLSRRRRLRPVRRAAPRRVHRAAPR